MAFTLAAIAFLPVVLLPFILLSGGIKPVHEMPATAKLISAITPTRSLILSGATPRLRSGNARFSATVIVS